MATTYVRKAVSTPNSPAPIAAFSQAIRAGNFLFVSGHVGMAPNTKKLVEGGAAAEAKMALTCLGAVLEAGGSSYKNVVKTTVLLADMKDFTAVNQVYATFFPEPYPARAAYQVASLPMGARVEIEAVALVE